MTPRPTRAMVLAAGLGTRMRPITDTLPKPLVALGGKTMLAHALDRLAAAGVTNAVVNVHWLADLVEAHCATRTGPPRITIRDERALLLDTGGGVTAALPLLGEGPFLVHNSDTLWIERGTDNIGRLADAFDPERMDALLLLANTADAVGFDGRGDFSMDGAGRLARRGTRESVPYAYAGVAVLRPESFVDVPNGPFSLNLIFDRALEADRLYGLPLDGTWLHVGDPKALENARARLHNDGFTA